MMSADSHGLSEVDVLLWSESPQFDRYELQAVYLVNVKQIRMRKNHFLDQPQGYYNDVPDNPEIPHTSHMCYSDVPGQSWDPHTSHMYKPYVL